VVGKLLAEANPRTRIERAKNVGVWREVLVYSLVKESIRVEYQSIWAPKIGAAVNVHHNISTASILRDVNWRSAIVRRQNNGLIVSPCIDWYRWVKSENLVEKGLCLFHLTHLIVRWATCGSHLLKDFLTQAVLNIGMLG